MNNEIYVMNADGTGLTNLTNHPANDHNARWSPDGRRIAFTSNRDGPKPQDRSPWNGPGHIAYLYGGQDIYVMNADGSGVVRLATDPPDWPFPEFPPNDVAPNWSPDCVASRPMFRRGFPSPALKAAV